MDALFPFSSYVTGKNFVGRRNDVTLLGNLLSQGEHVCLYEPPRTGITSLIQQSLYALRLKTVDFAVGQMNLLNIRSRGDFLLRLGSTVLKIFCSSPEEFEAMVQKYLPEGHLVFDRSAFSQRGEVLSASWELDDEDMKAILELPFRLSQDKGKQLYLILDAFHCIGLQEGADDLLRALSDTLKRYRDHNRCTFLFCGSGVNAMKDIFEHSIRFHRLVERVQLSQVEDREIADHLYKGFATGGKVIDRELLLGACGLFQGRLWYMNHFAALCDSMSRGYIMEPVPTEALNCLLAVHLPRFSALVSSLTTHQVNFLKATLEGVTRFSAAEVIRKYDLHSSANVKRVKDALMKKEVLVFNAADIPSFEDPLFEYWLRKYYFELVG